MENKKYLQVLVTLLAAAPALAGMSTDPHDFASQGNEGPRIYAMVTEGFDKVFYSADRNLMRSDASVDKLYLEPQWGLDQGVYWLRYHTRLAYRISCPASVAASANQLKLVARVSHDDDKRFLEAKGLPTSYALETTGKVSEVRFPAIRNGITVEDSDPASTAAHPELAKCRVNVLTASMEFAGVDATDPETEFFNQNTPVETKVFVVPKLNFDGTLTIQYKMSCPKDVVLAFGYLDDANNVSSERIDPTYSQIVLNTDDKVYLYILNRPSAGTWNCNFNFKSLKYAPTVSMVRIWTELAKIDEARTRTLEAVSQIVGPLQDLNAAKVDDLKKIAAKLAIYVQQIQQQIDSASAAGNDTTDLELDKIQADSMLRGIQARLDSLNDPAHPPVPVVDSSELRTKLAKQAARLWDWKLIFKRVVESNRTDLADLQDNMNQLVTEIEKTQTIADRELLGN